MAMLAAGYVMTATGLYLPGEKLISIPSHKYFVREGALGWFKFGKKKDPAVPEQAAEKASGNEEGPMGDEPVEPKPDTAPVR